MQSGPNIDKRDPSEPRTSTMWVLNPPGKKKHFCRRGTNTKGKGKK